MVQLWGKDIDAENIQERHSTKQGYGNAPKQDGVDPGTGGHPRKAAGRLASLRQCEKDCSLSQLLGCRPWEAINTLQSQWTVLEGPLLWG